MSGSIGADGAAIAGRAGRFSVVAGAVGAGTGALSQAGVLGSSGAGGDNPAAGGFEGFSQVWQAHARAVAEQTTGLADAVRAAGEAYQLVEQSNAGLFG